MLFWFRAIIFAQINDIIVTTLLRPYHHSYHNNYDMNQIKKICDILLKMMYHKNLTFFHVFLDFSGFFIIFIKKISLLYRHLCTTTPKKIPIIKPTPHLLPRTTSRMMLFPSINLNNRDHLYGITALMRACYNNTPTIAQTLINSKANLSISSHSGISVHRWARFYGWYHL